jgi:hypothetical protein
MIQAVKELKTENDILFANNFIERHETLLSYFPLAAERTE